MSKVRTWISGRRGILLLGAACFFLLALSDVHQHSREPDYLAQAEKIDCQANSSAKLIADAWQSLEHENVPRALACSWQVIAQYSDEADAQQRRLGTDIPANPETYPALNDVGTAWLIQGEALYTISQKTTTNVSEQMSALAAYQFATSRYPSAYSLYASGGYWPVRQAAFCRSYQYFPAQAVQLPAVYTDQYDFSNCYLPSGFMPKKEHYDMTVTSAWQENPHSGTTCIQVVYSAMSGGWEGVYLQYPENNWGEEAGLNLSRAAALTFWARGARGGEIVEFKIGGIKAEGAEHWDSLEVSLGTVKLETGWRQYTLDLRERNRSSIIGAFAWMVTAQNDPNGVTFYLDDIVFTEE